MAATAAVSEWDAQGNPIQSPAASGPTEWDAEGKPIARPSTPSLPAGATGPLPGVPAAPTPAGLQGPPAAPPTQFSQSTRDRILNKVLPSDTPVNLPANPASAGSAFLTAGRNIADRALKVPLSMALHPLDTATGLLESTPPGELIDTAMGRKTPEERTGEAYANTLHNQGPAQLTTDVAGDVLGGYLTGKALAPVAKAVGNLTAEPGGFSEAARQRISPTPSPQAVPPTLQTAQDLMKVITPSASDAGNLTKALQAETGNAIDYAKRNNIPINTKQDLSAAFKGAADEAKAHFDDNFLKPNEDQQVSVAGAGYKGKTVGEGQRATIGQINERLGQVNDQLRSAYSHAKGGQVSTALANEAELTAERDSLTNILNTSLAKFTGVSVDDVAALRQRVGRQYSVADNIGSAENQRMLSSQKASEGRRDIPVSATGAVMEGINKVRGGPVRISDRMMQRVLREGQFEPSTPLPKPNPPTPVASTRVPLAEQAGITEPQRPDLSVITPSPDEQAAVPARVAARAEQRQAATAANQAASQQEVLHANELGQQAQRAAQQRAAQASEARQANTQAATSANLDAAQQEVLRSRDLGQRAQDAAQERGQQATTERQTRRADTAAKHGPGTHAFSRSAWQAVYPNGDVEAAAKRAQDQGYRVVD